jgi:flagellar hook-associated protein 2
MATTASTGTVGSTNYFSGLASGIDWSSMITQLMAVDQKQVDSVTNEKTDQENKLTEWQGVNTKLLALKTAAQGISDASSFNIFKATTTSNTSTAASDILTATTDSTASAGNYNIKVTNLATAEKISSKNYTATDTALSLTGDILISGKVVHIVSTDSLASLKDKINAINTGTNASHVTASIVSDSATSNHLVLSSDETGAAGIQILDTSSTNLLQSMGFISSSTSIKNSTSDGAKSDLFTDTNTAVGSLLGLSNPLGSTPVTIGDITVNIDLSADSITDIANKINAAAAAKSPSPSKVSASVISETDVNNNTQYRIDISGTTSFADNANVLQTLGVLKGSYSTVAQVLTGATANTSGGSTPITQDTHWQDIDGASVQVGASFTITGKKHDGTSVSGSYTIDTADKLSGTVNDLLDAINTLYGVSVATIDSAGKLQIQDTITGDSSLSFNMTTNNPAGSSLDFGAVSTSTEGRSMQITAGEDAQLNVDNVTVTRSTNSISDLINGVTLNLVGASDSSTVTLKIDRDLDGIEAKIQSMVDAFNPIMQYINTQFSYDSDTQTTGGVLFGDGTLSSVKSDLISSITNTITGASGDFNSLPLIGITLDSSSNLTIDDTKLTDALTTNFDAVQKLFAAYGSSTDPSIQYVSNTDNTQGGAYAVVINQAATRTTLTGTNAITGLLGADESLNIQDVSSGRTTTVALTSAMTLSDIVNAINSEMDKETTQQLTGSNGTGYSANTTFSSIPGADNGDVITFSGTRSNGMTVTGSYTVNTTDNLGSLLSSIEEMYQGDVRASLDGTGKLVITDNLSGDSSTALTLNTSAVSGLDFGAVTETTSGRSAIPITASVSSDNKLVLTQKTYGAGQAMNVSESGGSALGINSINQVYGLNVAGTINGVAATGVGQTLTLKSSGNTADGLSVIYSGATPTSSTFTLTLGIADLLNRQLGFITNSTDGYVSFKETSIQDSIDAYTTQISQMETLLSKKQQDMTNRFVAMEVALQKMQDQSSWLTSQISGLLPSSNYI